MNLGKIVGVSKNRHIIIRSIDWHSLKLHPNIGDKVFNIDKNKIGMIYDIFGPVSKPYLSIKLFNSKDENIEQYKSKKGDFLYSFKEVKHKKKYPPKTNRPSRSSRPRNGPPRNNPSKNRSFQRVSRK